jgi:hypothetical protein
MPKVSIWNGQSIQNAEVSGTNWRLMSPHPPAARREITYANGKFATEILATRAGSFPEHIMAGLNHAGMCYSFGSRVGDFPIDSSRWQQGWRISKEMHAKIKNGTRYVYTNSPHNIQWKSSPIVDQSQIWLGIFLSASLTVEIAKAKGGVGVIWQLGKSSKLHLAFLDGGYLALGAGASAGISAGILTGFGDTRSIDGFAKNEFGFNFDVAGKWGEFAKMANRGTALTKVLETAGTSLKAIKDVLIAIHTASAAKGRLDNAKKGIEACEKMLKDPVVAPHLQKAAQSLDLPEVAKAFLTSLGIDGTNQNMEFIDLLGGGLEICVYGGSSRITGVFPL